MVSGGLETNLGKQLRAELVRQMTDVAMGCVAMTGLSHDDYCNRVGRYWDLRAAMDALDEIEKKLLGQ